MSKDQSTLLSHIEQFLTANDMTPRAFGILVLKDPNFVFDLRGTHRKPRRVWPETESRVMQYIVSYERKRA